MIIASSAYAASEVFAYGETLEKAQDAALKVATESAKSKDTCVGGISTCKKQDDGLFRCGAYVADHKGSCNKDGGELKKALDAIKGM
jgi:hypothetical protein